MEIQRRGRTRDITYEIMSRDAVANGYIDSREYIGFHKRTRTAGFFVLVEIQQLRQIPVAAIVQARSIVNTDSFVFVDLVYRKKPYETIYSKLTLFQSLELQRFKSRSLTLRRIIKLLYYDLSLVYRYGLSNTMENKIARSSTSIDSMCNVKRISYGDKHDTRLCTGFAFCIIKLKKRR